MGMRTNVSSALQSLSLLCLDANEHQGYTDRDFLNACVVFSHVFADVVWTENSALPQADRETLIVASGKAIRDTIFMATGRDMRDIAKGAEGAGQKQ